MRKKKTKIKLLKQYWHKVTHRSNKKNLFWYRSLETLLLLWLLSQYTSTVLWYTSYNMEKHKLIKTMLTLNFQGCSLLHLWSHSHSLFLLLFFSTRLIKYGGSFYLFVFLWLSPSPCFTKPQKIWNSRL